jgi:hypothetical protein
MGGRFATRVPGLRTIDSVIRESGNPVIASAIFNDPIT